MPTIPGVRVLPRAQIGMKRDMVALFTQTASQIGGVIQRGADANGAIPKRNRDAVKRQSGEIVQRIFVGLDGRSAYGQDGVTPLAQYPQLLNKWYVYIVGSTVKAHRDWLKRTVSPELYRWLRSARPPAKVAELANPALVLATYDPLHTFVNGQGYTLSDLIWQNSTKTRLQIDAMIADALSQGMSALELSKRLEQFLVPGRAALRTKRPYGTDASYNSLRLATTELTAAFGRVTLTAARLNPYVDGIIWRLSGSHGKPDVCDDNAAGSPYPVDNVPQYPAHPFERCTISPKVTASPSEITQQLQDQMDNGEAPPFTPANDDALILWLLGTTLYSFYRQLTVQSSP